MIRFLTSWGVLEGGGVGFVVDVGAVGSVGEGLPAIEEGPVGLPLHDADSITTAPSAPALAHVLERKFVISAQRDQFKSY